MANSEKIWTCTNIKKCKSKLMEEIRLSNLCKMNGHCLEKYKFHCLEKYKFHCFLFLFSPKTAFI